jgi:7-cyano-7-deazaguanine synthase
MKKHSCLVVLSGGQDSTTCTFWAKQEFEEVHAVTFAYSQRHLQEIYSAKRVGELAGVNSHHFINIGDKALAGTSPLVNPSSPVEKYENWQSLPGGLEKTFVPARNALFFTAAANWAYTKDIHHLVTGICQEDSGGYPDCREEFRQAIERALELAMDYHPFYIHAPLMYMSKAMSVRMASELPGCWEALAYTHTAYDGSYPPTSNDHASLLRAKGFEQAGLPDPLVLRAWQEGLMELPKTTNYEPARRMGK